MPILIYGSTITPNHKFHVTLAVTKFQNIQETVNSVYGHKAWKRSQIYDIIKKGGATCSRPEGFQQEDASQKLFVWCYIAAKVESDRQLTIK
jgi:hypothetical protein